jgi:hypothetical protein
MEIRPKWKFRMTAFTLAVLICCSMIACDGARGMEVELDAFSGRPNPKWTLSPEKASEFLTKIKALPTAGDAPHIPDLGFRGFVLRSGDQSIRVYGGRVLIEAPPRGSRILRDTAGIQAELIAQARSRGFEAVVTDSGQR